ncbi:tape measure protein [[Ruminococcus] gnavus]|uniref:Tape measure protein n=1 Tax=Mediterraneibacter gnavus TaxID=33038 RepID=A0AAJ1GEY7_MEDGN|nr:tape measure protein [Mediterraneibacter gnavus]MCZ0690975.1 tape measure protein [Mediterraneibacter gnavus]
MAESYSVKAILSAQDRGFTSAFKSAMGTVSNLKSTLTSGIGFGIMAGIGQKAFGAVTSSIGGMVSELNSSSAAWKTFNGNMSMVGKGADEIASVKKELQEFAEDTIYSASDMASTYAQLSAVGIKSTNKLVKGFGGLAAAAENPKQAMKTLSQQATQMAAKPTVAWADFKLMIEQTPAGISAVAKEMGMTTTELVQNVQDGKIATEDFFDAIAKVGTNDAFTKLATEYKTVDQAMDGLTETVSNKLAPSFDVLSGRAIKSLDGIINKIGDFDGNEIAGKLTGFLDKASGYWNVLKTEALEVKIAFGDAFSAIGEDLGKITGAFGSTESISSFSSAMDSASGALKTFAGFLEEHSEIIAKVISKLPQLFVAYKGFKIAKSVAPFVGAFTSAIAGLAGAGISKIAGKLFGISKGQEAVGKSSAASSKKMLASAKAFMMLGAGVALISGGFFLLAQGAKAVADSGPLAVAVLVGMVGALIGLSIGMMKMLSAMSGGTKKLTAMSTAMLALGGSILLISAAFWVLSDAAIRVSEAGPLAIGVLVGMVAAIAGLLIVAKMVAPTLTAGAVGFVAFGAAVVLAAAGIAILTASAISLANAGPLAIGVMFGLIVAIGGLMVVAAAVAPVLTAGAVGLIAFGAAAVLVGAAVLLASAGLTLVASVLPIVAEYGLQASVAIGALGAAMTVFGAGTIVAGAGCTVLAVGLLAVGVAVLGVAVGVVAFGVAMTAACVGVLAMAAALLAVNSSMKSIAKNAKTAQKSIESMKDSVSIVNDGLDALGNKAKSAVKSIVSVFDNGAGKARSSGQKLGDSAKEGVQNGLQPTQAVAIKTVSAVLSSLSSGASGAYSSGYNIGLGFANGMSATLGYIRSVAAQMAAAADAAVRAKAKIHSPSRVFAGLGVYVGEGFALGIESMSRKVAEATQNIVEIPTLSTDMRMRASGALDSELSGDYSYNRNATYTIVVPVEYNGREAARVTTEFTQKDLESRESMKMRLKGERSHV